MDRYTQEQRAAYLSCRQAYGSEVANGIMSKALRDASDAEVDVEAVEVWHQVHTSIEGGDVDFVWHQKQAVTHIESVVQPALERSQGITRTTNSISSDEDYHDYIGEKEEELGEDLDSLTMIYNTENEEDALEQAYDDVLKGIER